MTFLTRGQLDLLRKRVEAGADPVGVALWISRVTDIGDLTVGVLAAAAEDLRRGAVPGGMRRPMPWRASRR